MTDVLEARVARILGIQVINKICDIRRDGDCAFRSAMVLFPQEIQEIFGDVGDDGEMIAALRMAVMTRVCGSDMKRYMEKSGGESDTEHWTDRCKKMENRYVDVEAPEWLAMVDLLGVGVEMIAVYDTEDKNSNMGDGIVEIFTPKNGTSRNVVQVVHTAGYLCLGPHFEPVIVEHFYPVTARRYFVGNDGVDLNLMRENPFKVWLNTRGELANADSEASLWSRELRKSRTDLFLAIMEFNGYTWDSGGYGMELFCKGWDLFMSSSEQNSASENDFGVYIIQHLGAARQLSPPLNVEQAMGFGVHFLQQAAAGDVGEACYNLDVLNKCGVIDMLNEREAIECPVIEAHQLLDKARSLGFKTGTSDVNDVIKEAREGDTFEIWNLVITYEGGLGSNVGPSAFLVPMEARVIKIFDATVFVKFVIGDLLATVKNPTQENRVLQLCGNTAGLRRKKGKEEAAFMDKIGNMCPLVVETLAEGNSVNLVELACIAVASAKHIGFKIGPDVYDHDEGFRHIPKENFGANMTRVLKV